MRVVGSAKIPALSTKESFMKTRFPRNKSLLKIPAGFNLQMNGVGQQTEGTYADQAYGEFAVPIDQPIRIKAPCWLGLENGVRAVGFHSRLFS